MRTFLRVNKVTPISALYGDLGWETVHNKTKLSAVSFWLRLCHMDENPCHCLSTHSNKTWNFGIKQIFEECGLDIWNKKQIVIQ